MFIEDIKLINFRNIKYAEFATHNKINFIMGSNAQGKTNFIEAIYLAAFLKSFRTQKNYDLIKEGEKKLLVEININKYFVESNISISISKNNKLISVNNKKINNNKNYFRNINVIIFHPDEINYISSYPVFRRNLIDRSIFYTNYNYINLYKNYFRCLKQRNSLLKNKKNLEDCWKEQLVKYGSEIIRERIKYIEKINNFFSNSFFKNLNSEKYFISYSNVYTNSSNTIENILREDFSRKFARERLLGYTLVGPHKDDIQFYINDHPAEGFASQGQKRSLIISFKMAQILDYKSVQGHYPVLILDDMTSELDIHRKNVLLENLLENSGQVFITSTDFKQSSNSDQSRVFTVNNGEISVAK